MTAKAAKRRRADARRESMCGSKVRYPGEVAAVHAAALTGLNYYRCPYCKGFHLTKQGTRKTGHEVADRKERR